jgi:hypothetical protein
MRKTKITFDEFCHTICDGLYDPKFPLEAQCTGYKDLLKMIAENIRPASLEEMKRWETSPTQDELLEVPDIKYLRSLNFMLREYIVENWDGIMKLDLCRFEFMKIK